MSSVLNLTTAAQMCITQGNEAGLKEVLAAQLQPLLLLKTIREEKQYHLLSLVLPFCQLNEETKTTLAHIYLDACLAEVDLAELRALFLPHGGLTLLFHLAVSRQIPFRQLYCEEKEFEYYSTEVMDNDNADLWKTQHIPPIQSDDYRELGRRGAIKIFSSLSTTDENSRVFVEGFFCYLLKFFQEHEKADPQTWPEAEQRRLAQLTAFLKENLVLERDMQFMRRIFLVNYCVYLKYFLAFLLSLGLTFTKGEDKRLRANKELYSFLFEADV